MRSADLHQGRLDAHFGAEVGFWSDLYDARDVLATIHRYRLALTLRWIDALEMPARASVLEVGCGAGVLAVEIARRDLDVEATDPVGGMLDRARQAANREGLADRIHVRAAEARALPYPDHSFRLVVALGVLPWIDTPDEALAEFARVLEPGGHLIASTNNRTPLHALADPVRLPILAPLRDGVRQMASAVRPDGRPPRARPIGFARPAEFAGQLAANGFSLIRGQGFGFGPFTILGQQLLQDRLGNRLERELQQRVERGYRRLEGVAAQYLILARTSGARRADPSVNLVR